MATSDSFWERVRVLGPDDCWEWMGCTTEKGYGKFQGSSLRGRAHRLSWYLNNGPIPAGLWVLHSCDNPPCVNPAHLFLGTNRDNVEDMVSKGRHLCGEKKPLAKLSNEDAKSIYVIRHLSVAELSRHFGVVAKTIRGIQSGRMWRRATEGLR